MHLHCRPKSRAFVAQLVSCKQLHSINKVALFWLRPWLLTTDHRLINEFQRPINDENSVDHDFRSRKLMHSHILTEMWCLVIRWFANILVYECSIWHSVLQITTQVIILTYHPAKEYVTVVSDRSNAQTAYSGQQVITFEKWLYINSAFFNGFDSVFTEDQSPSWFFKTFHNCLTSIPKSAQYFTHSFTEWVMHSYER